MVNLQARFPPSLEFDTEPDREQLSVVVGPDYASNSYSWQEDDSTIRVGPGRIPFRSATAFIVLFSGVMSALPWVLPRFGVPMPPHLPPALVWGMTAALWLLIVPTMVGVFYLLHRTVERLGPGAIVDRRTRELRLPWIDRTVPAARIVRFVDMQGRHRYGGRDSQVGQYCVLFRDERERWVMAPFVRSTGRMFGADPAQRLAEFYGLTVQRLRPGRVDR